MADSDGKPKLTEGAVGAGLVLVVAPALAMYFGIDRLSENPSVGLPVLAIFGIMILFGSMALTSTLFARLGLANPKEALALPSGSIRAAIALSLIVLFAIISIMLFQSLAKAYVHVYVIPQLDKDSMAAIVKDPKNRVVALRPVACPAVPPAAASSSASAASAARDCFDVHLGGSVSPDAIDIAKQLLILVGTLMTSVTSYYFAARTAQPPSPSGKSDSAGDKDAAKKTSAADGKAAAPGADAGTAAASVAGAQDHAQAGDDELDGCDVADAQPTPDTELPAAKGGVQS